LANLIAIGIFTGFIFSMVALGYTLVYGVLRLINFAHSEVLTSGAFGSYFVTRVIWGYQPLPVTGVSAVIYVVLGIVVGGVVGALVALLIERVAYRPLRRRHAPKLTFLISAIGASYFLYNFIGKEFGRYQQTLPNAPNNGTAFTVFGAQITTYDLITAVAAIVLLVALDLLVSRTKLGRGIRAVAQDAEAASLMGVNIDWTIASTFAIGGFLGGAAGFLFALLENGLSYQMGFKPALFAFTAAVLGGIGNVRGAMIGGLVLGLAMNVPQYWLQNVWLEEVVGFLVLVLVLLFRPTGILGERLGRSA